MFNTAIVLLHHKAIWDEVVLFTLLHSVLLKWSPTFNYNGIYLHTILFN